MPFTKPGNRNPNANHIHNHNCIIQIAMKTFTLIFYLILLPSIVASAQKKDEQAVATAVQRLNQAMIDGNQSLLDELTSSKLTYGHSSWLIEDKDAFITAMVDGTSGFSSIDLSEQSIAFTGNVAIVRHKFSAGTDNKGQQPVHVNLGVMQVWQKEKGQLLLIARQATKL